MIKQILYISLIFILLFSSCKNDPYVLKGRLMANCDVPGANKEMFIYQNIGMFHNGGHILTDVYSDENGYFEIEYTPDNSNMLELGVSGGGTVLKFIPAKENLDLGNVYYGSIPTNYIRRLEVHESYSENDTLHISSIKIPGPFNSGILDTVYNKSFSKYPIFYIETPQQSFNYIVSSDSILFKNHCYFDVELCDTSFFGDAVMVIE